ncbi:MAG: transglutaminase domain-containing protein [Oscillospiraceae bacterium]
MAASKKRSSDNLFLLIIMLVVLVSIVWIFKNDIKTLNEKIDSITSVQNKLMAENAELSVQIQKSRFYNEASLMQSGKAKDISGISVTAPTKEFDAEINDFGNKELFNRNKLYMNKIEDYGVKVSIEYLSSEENQTLNEVLLQYIKNLSDDICEGCTSDYDKAYAIAIWVSDNIYYNNDKAQQGIDADTISLETSLALHRTTCAGYSNLYSALCEAQGIYCINLRGNGTGGLHETQDWNTLPRNHEWNGVYCDGRWYFTDTTWASQNEYYNDQEIYTDVIDKRYIMMDFYKMSEEHRIDSAEHRGFFNIY